MKFTKSVLTLAVLVSTMLFTACNKNDSASSDKATMQVFLTDDPGDYEEVLIDVQDVRINYSSDSTNGWMSLSNVKKGTYDILKLVNDKDTMLANAELSTGKIQQIRLVLGTENYVKIDGQLIKLETPSAQQSGLKINIHQDINEGILYKMLLDFDAARSIVQTGNGKYILKPVIRATLQAQGGTIRGFVLPDSVRTAVMAIQGTDTIGTYTLNGGYTIKGLPAGTYSLYFNPDSPFVSQTKTNIVVNTNTVTVVDTVRLQ
jgi:hypothetical protein